LVQLSPVTSIAVSDAVPFSRLSPYEFTGYAGWRRRVVFQLLKRSPGIHVLELSIHSTAPVRPEINQLHSLT